MRIRFSYQDGQDPGVETLDVTADSNGEPDVEVSNVDGEPIYSLSIPTASGSVRVHMDGVEYERLKEML